MTNSDSFPSTTPVPASVQESIDLYLDRVEAELQNSSVGRQERQAICHDIDSHIWERLNAARREIDAALVRVVLADMAAPHEYANRELPADRQHTRRQPVDCMPPTARRTSGRDAPARVPLGAAVSLCGSLTAVLTSVLGTVAVAAGARGEELLITLVMILIFGGIVAIALARHALATQGPTWSTIFGVCVVPIYLAVAIPFVFLEPVVENILGFRGDTFYSMPTIQASIATWGLVSLLGAALIASLITRQLLVGPGWSPLNGSGKPLNGSGKPTDTSSWHQGLEHSWRVARLASGRLALAVPYLVAAQMILIVLAWAAAMIETETIVFSGPLLTAVGLAVAWGCHVLGSARGVQLGLSAPAVCLFCLGMIFWFELSPNQAHGPIAFIGLIYASIAIPMAVSLYRPLFDLAYQTRLQAY